MFGFKSKPQALDLKFPEGFFEKMNTVRAMSPDISELEQQWTARLFVCDDLQQHHPRHNLLNEYCVPICTGYTADQFSLWRRNLGQESFPIPLKVSFPSTNAPLARIKGQIMAIRPHHYYELDRHYQNGVMFQRKRVRILVPFRREYVLKYQDALVINDGKWKWDAPMEIVPFWCYMYVGKEQFWEDELDGGYKMSPVKRFTPKEPQLTPNFRLSEYYYFTVREYHNIPPNP